MTTEFDGAADRAALKSASVNGIAINFLSQTVRFALQFLYQVMLARILMPADFGIVAMAAPILAFIALLADFGLTQATVQRPNITQEQLSLIFWINCLLSLALALMTIGAAPAIGAFYGDERVTPVVMALGSAFFIGGLYAQHLALLNRRLAFFKLAVIDLSSFVVGSAIGLVAALYGLRYWAIVLAQIGTSLVALVLAWINARWIPARPRWTSDAKALLGFGGNVTTFNVVNYFARNLDNVLIGKYIGSVGLGLYDRAYKLLLLPLSQITGPVGKVAIPLLAKLRDDPAAYRRTYMRLVEAICLLTYPGIVFAIVTSDRLINFVLGEKWQGVTPIFRILAIGAFFAPISVSTGWLFITQDRTRELRNWGVISSSMFVASFVAGLHWGALGVATCYIAVGAVQGPMIWWKATDRGPLRFRQLMLGLAPYGLSLLLTFGVELLLRWQLPPTPITLLLLAAVAYPLFILGMAPTRRGREATMDVYRQMRTIYERISRRRSVGDSR